MTAFVQEIALALTSAVGGVRVVTRDEPSLLLELATLTAEDGPLPAMNKRPRVVSWSPITGGQLHEEDETRAYAAGKSGELAPCDPDEFLTERFTDWLGKQTGKDKALLVFALVGCDAAFSDQAETGGLARRALIEAVRIGKANGALIALIGREASVHGDLVEELQLVRHSVPTREEARPHIEAFLREHGTTLPPNVLDELVDAGQGLTLSKQLDGIGVALNRAVSEGRKFATADVLRFKEKEMAGGALIARPPKRGLKDLVGYESLKDWLGIMRASMTPEARKFGLPSPKGVLLAGPPGTGKSRLPEAIAREWGVPWVLFDVSAIFGSYIGESEGAMRNSLVQIEKMAPCVLHIDEVDTAFSKRKGDDNDGGTSLRVLGTFLRWLADKDVDAFIVMTSNHPEQLDPALIRRGRLDDIFFVDLPSVEQRRNVWRHYLRNVTDTSGIDDTLVKEMLTRLATESDSFSPSEIEGVVLDARRRAFATGARKPALAEVYDRMKGVVPIAKSMAESVEAMRKWARENARPA